MLQFVYTWKISILDYGLIKNSPASLYSSRLYVGNANSNDRNERSSKNVVSVLRMHSGLSQEPINFFTRNDHYLRMR